MRHASAEAVEAAGGGVEREAPWLRPLEYAERHPMSEHMSRERGDASAPASMFWAMPSVAATWMHHGARRSLSARTSTV